MQEIRKRKQRGNKPKETVPIDAKRDGSSADVHVETETAVKTNGGFLIIVYILFGLAVASVLGYKYATFIKLMHENDMWFSEISVSLRFCTDFQVVFLIDRSWRGRYLSVPSQDCITHIISSL